MSAVAVAVAVVGAAASYHQSQKAEEAQKKAGKKAEALTREQMAIEQERLGRYEQFGAPAREQQAAMTGVLGPEAQQAAVGAFATSPGQQFLRDQQERALVRNAAAIGGLGGGNIRSALQQQAFQRAQTDWERQFGRLGALSGAGQAVAGTQAELGQLGAAQQARLIQQQGAARASGIQERSRLLQETLGTGVGLYAMQGGFNQPQQPQTLEQQLRTQQGAPSGTVLAPSTT